MSRLPKISETEWEIMKIVWSRSPVSSGVIIDELIAADPTWHPATVKTLLNRLVKKGALDFHKDGRSYLYRAVVPERDCVRAASESFLQRVFGGSLHPMLAHLVEHRTLSAADIAHLRKLLNEKSPGGKTRNRKG